MNITNEISAPVNGSFTVLYRHCNTTKEFLFGRRLDNKRMELIGGGEDEGENPVKTATREILEETSLLIKEKGLREIGYFRQRVPVRNAKTKELIRLEYGLVTLFVYTTSLTKALPLHQKDEFSELLWMTVEEVILRRQEFMLGHIRMFLEFYSLSMLDDYLHSKPIATKNLADQITFWLPEGSSKIIV